jgi:hypothetical protein
MLWDIVLTVVKQSERIFISDNRELETPQGEGILALRPKLIQHTGPDETCEGSPSNVLENILHRLGDFISKLSQEGEMVLIKDYKPLLTSFEPITTAGHEASMT